MRPILFRLGPVSVPSYGALLVLGLAAAVLIAMALARRHGLRRDDVLALGALALGGGVVGAWLLFVLTNLGAIVREPALLLRLRGMVFYGGLAGGAAACAAYALLLRIPLHATADLAALVLPVGHAIGRVGCFLAGCCFGSESHGPFAVRLPGAGLDPGVAAAATATVHPVQLYEACGLLIVFGVLLGLERWPGRRPFTLVLAYLAGYSVLRFVVEMFRGDAIRGFVVPGLLSTSQAIAIGSGLAAGALLVWRHRRARHRRAADSPAANAYNCHR
ncbi:MAG: prolipoprotein diacylglyceryl transferase [Deltaproteobacteria bacterium]|nr:prolipoprotein diacylglyceryl transferase [Deltaproteobacteria bacterium]